MYVLGSRPSSRILSLRLHYGGRGKQANPIRRDRTNHLGFLMFPNGFLAEKNLKPLTSYEIRKTKKEGDGLVLKLPSNYYDGDRRYAGHDYYAKIIPRKWRRRQTLQENLYHFRAMRVADVQYVAFSLFGVHE